MLLATFLLSLMGVLVKHLQHIPAHEVVFFRAGISFGVCLAQLLRRGVSPWGHRRKLLLARGAAGTAALLLYFHTLQSMPLATAVTVQYLSPLFTVLIAGLFLREGATSREWGGFVLAFAGVALVKGVDPRVSAPDLAFGLAAALFSALAYNFVRLLRESDDPLVVVFYFPLVTLPVVGPYTLTHWTQPHGTDWVWLLAVGLLTQAGQIHLTRAYHLERASRVSHFTYVGVLFALFFGYVFFGEGVPVLALLGMILIATGVFVCSRVRRGATPT